MLCERICETASCGGVVACCVVWRVVWCEYGVMQYSVVWYVAPWLTSDAVARLC
jgi:hypothetical protein